ncbi:MAG: amidohydrolase [Proteocatella sp.]
MILVNGAIKNFSGKDYQWIKLNNKKIYDLGYGTDYEKYLDKDVKIVDLKGRSVLPGFFDSHVHLDETVINETNIDFGEATNFKYIEARLKEASQNRPDKKIIMGLSIHDHTLEEKRLPTRRELDRMCPEYPVWIASKDMQRSILNSKALELIKVPFNLNGMQIDNKGVVTGLLEHEANAYAKSKIMKLYTFEEKCDMIKIYIEKNVLPKGITTLVDVESNLINDMEDYKKFLKFTRKLPVTIELYYSTTDIEEIKARKLTRLGGDLGVDGSFTSRNAALFENYADVKSNGELYFSQEELNSLVSDCYKNSIQIGLHAVGDRAYEQVLVAHEYAQKIYGNLNLRHRVEHAELMSDEQIKRTSDLGLVLSMQPVFETMLGNKENKLYEKYNELYVKSLGERHLRTNMFKEILDAGIVICGGSDSALTPIDPILGIYSAVNHPKEDHRVTLEQAIRMFTADAAYGVNAEEERGILLPGKQADIVILDQNIDDMDIKDIKNVLVDFTIRDGKITYIRNEGELNE